MNTNCNMSSKFAFKRNNNEQSINSEFNKISIQILKAVNTLGHVMRLDRILIQCVLQCKTRHQWLPAAP